VRKWSQPAQRNRTGQAPPPAFTLDGSPQVPYGTATAPIAYRACQLGKMTADLAHDLGRDIAAGFTRVCLGGDVARGQGEVVGQAGGWAAQGGSAPESGSRSGPSGVLAGLDAAVSRQLPVGGQEGQPVQEGLDVGAAEPGWVLSLIVVAGAQGR
jgi:hypothetical protein